MAGFDQPGMHRADRYLIHPGSLDGDEREMAEVFEFGRGRGVVAHRIPVLGPVTMPHQSARFGMPDGQNPVQVCHLALESAGRKRQICQ